MVIGDKMKNSNNTTRQALLDEDQVQNVIRYGREPMDVEEAQGVTKLMIEKGVKWDDLPVATHKALGGELRFANNVMTRMNEKGAEQNDRDEMVKSLGLRVQRETQPSFRLMYGLKNTAQEIKSGALNLFGEYPEEKQDAQQSYIDSQIRSNLHESYYKSADLLTPTGEALPSAALGGVVGAATAPSFSEKTV